MGHDLGSSRRKAWAKKRARFSSSLLLRTPPQHFVPSDAPLLQQYAEMICQAEQATRAIEREGAVLPNGRVNPWLAIQRGALRLMGVYANRLRLCPGARTDAKIAGRALERHVPPSYYERMHRAGGNE